MTIAVEDQLAIQQLYARYNYAIDFEDADGWTATFTPGASFGAGPAGSFSGTQELAGFAHSWFARGKARHWTNNLLLEASGDVVRGKAYVMVLRLEPGTPTNVLLTGVYTDEIVRSHDGWRFRSRSVALD